MLQLNLYPTLEFRFTCDPFGRRAALAIGGIMTIKHIVEFEQSSKLLRSAMESRDQEKIKQFKQEVESAWNYLLLVKPATTEKTLALIEFLLEQIDPNSNSDMFGDQCKWKILALSRSLVENQHQVERLDQRRL